MTDNSNRSGPIQLDVANPSPLTPASIALPYLNPRVFFMNVGALVKKPEAMLVAWISGITYVMGRIDTNIMKACKGHVVAKEGAEGLLGLGIVHPDYPKGLGVVIKLGHGSDDTAMLYIAKTILGVLGWELPLPPRLIRQRPVIHPNVVPENLRPRLKDVHLFDPSEPLDDQWEDA